MKINEIAKKLFFKPVNLMKRIQKGFEIKRLYSEIYEIIEKAGNESELRRYWIRKRVYLGLIPDNMILEKPFNSIKEAVKAIKTDQLQGSWIMNDAGKVVKKVRIWL